MKSPNKLYEFHIRNRRRIDVAIKRVGLTLRSAIAQQDRKTEQSFLPLYALLLGIWAECKLLELLYEPSGFTDEDRAKISAERNRSQIRQWKTAVDLAFRKQYKIPRASLNKRLSHSARSRYETLQNMLDSDLSQIIEIRNKLAHGQWQYPLNNLGTDVSEKLAKSLLQENLLSLQFKKKLIALLSSIIHDLIVSKSSFERDFDDHFNKIEETRRNLQTRDYEKYVVQQVAKHKRGREKARRNS